MLVNGAFHSVEESRVITMHNVAPLPRLLRTTAATSRAVQRTRPTQTAGARRTPRTQRTLARMAAQGPELISAQDITNDIHLCCHSKKICGFKITWGRVTLDVPRASGVRTIYHCVSLVFTAVRYLQNGLDNFIKHVYFLLFCIEITISVKYFIL